MKSKLTRAAAAATAAIVAVLACGCGPSAPSNGGGAGGEDMSVNFGIVPGWNDNLDVANLYKYVLERNGYEFEITELSEIATVFTATAEGDVDAFSGAPTSIHKAYWDRYKSDLEDLGAYYDNGAVYMAVPEYMTDVRSIEDLPAHAEDFGGKIYGIEPGSGLVTTTQETVFPAYGLEDSFDLATSSTAAMLAELKRATDAGKPIAVTIWAPWWVNTTYPVRKLDDPKNAYGDVYPFSTVANADFSHNSPAAAAMMASLKLTDEQFNTLDDAIYNQFEPGQEQEAVAAWFEDNPELLEQMESSLRN